MLKRMDSVKSCRLLSLCIGLPTWIVILGDLRADQFIAEGVLRSITYSPGGKEMSHNEYEFSFASKDHQWKLRTVDCAVRDGKKKGQAYRETGCDGVDTYTKLFWTKETLQQFIENPNLNKLSTKARRPVNIHTRREGVSEGAVSFSATTDAFQEMGSVHTGIYPVAEDYFGKVLWIGLASAQYFSSARSNTIPSLHQNALAGYREIEEYKFTSLGSNLGLPGVLELYEPGYEIKEGKRSGRVRYPPPYDKSYLVGRYRVLTSTNMGEMQLPTSFQFESYSVSANDKRAVHFLRNRITCDSVGYQTLTTNVAFVPEFSGSASVTDHRIAAQKIGVPYIRYSTEGGKFLTRDDKLLKERSEKLLAASAKAREPKRLRFALTWLTVSLVLIPLVIISFRIRQNKVLVAGTNCKANNKGELHEK